MSLPATPSQTVGPFFHIGLSWLWRSELFGPDARGLRVAVSGRVLDGDGKPVPDALLEIWQADADGRYAHAGDARGGTTPAFPEGFGRVATDPEGCFRFATVVPGSVPGPGGRPQAPHLVVSVFMRGLLRRLTTRIYFPGQAGNALDPVLALVEPARRGTLIAVPGASHPAQLEWNVVLQGERETVFFDC